MTAAFRLRDIEDYFWSRVARTPDGCWPWTRARTTAGYGHFYKADPATGSKVHFYAHRLSLELTGGALPPGEDACHRCDNPPCVRPSHLFAGSRTANVQDCRDKGRLVVPILRGSDHHSAKLDEADVVRIRALRSDGVLLRVLAARFGVSITTISQVCLRKGWDHV